MAKIEIKGLEPQEGGSVMTDEERTTTREVIDSFISHLENGSKGVGTVHFLENEDSEFSGKGFWTFQGLRPSDSVNAAAQIFRAYTKSAAMYFEADELSFLRALLFRLSIDEEIMSAKEKVKENEI